MTNDLAADLRQYGLKHPEFLEILEAAAQVIASVAKGSANEATISATFDREMALALQKIGIAYAPKMEQGLSIGAKRVRGRIDSRVGDVIIEFKQVSTLKTPAQRDAATLQVVTYGESIYADTGRAVAAYVTDGVTARRISIDSSGTHEGPFAPLNGRFLREYAQAVTSTSLRALSGDNLVEHFTGEHAPTKALATALFNELSDERAIGRTKMLFAEWQLLFKLAHDDTSQQRALADRRVALEDAVGVSLGGGSFQPQYRALFALQTAYSIVLKCIGMNVLQGVTKFGLASNLASISQADEVTTQRFLAMMEDGSDVRERGVENLLEGDFFSWYAHKDQFSQALHDAIQPVVTEIADFEALPAFHGDHVAAQDLFKDLYMHMIPEKVRHSLGEYYTPSWLADDTIEQALDSLTSDGREAWRLLDPTCGSGTFLTMGMQKVLDETRELPATERLNAVLHRIVGIDLNPLAVLTARMNYFINISPLLENETRFHIPVYLGDASVTPKTVTVGGVSCLGYSIQTVKGPLSVTIPKSALEDVARFTTVMAKVELLTKARSSGGIKRSLLELVAESDQNDHVEDALAKLADALVELESLEWNGIWPRIIADFLTTGSIGRFQVIVGNPPWIDWKNLPENYRRSLVALCVERDIFSGDGVTGGINLNVCALIALTTAENWLAEHGALAMLMPDTLLFQQSYEGFRNLKTSSTGGRVYLAKLTDWQKSGHPFKPVQQKFLTYVLTADEPEHWPGVPVREIHKARGASLPSSSTSLAYANLPSGLFEESASWAEPVHSGKTYYSRGTNSSEVRAFGQIAGLSKYRGREGIEFYPQELLLFEYVRPGRSSHTAVFRNYQSSKSKHRVPVMERELETSIMRPLVKGPMIRRFGIDVPQYYVPFYYKPEHAGGRSPIPLETLLDTHPRLAQLLVSSRSIFEDQTEYNQRIIGAVHATEFYAVARVGAYSHAPNYVCYRDNTRWGASVLSDVPTPWGSTAKPVFQNHAVSISERPDGSPISLDEAHYICAILNSTLATAFIERSSEQRSFKIRVPIDIPVFDEANSLHSDLARQSRLAHDASDEALPGIAKEIDVLIGQLFVN